MRRLWPSGLVGRVALILAATLLVAQAASFFLYVRDQGESTKRIFARLTAQRIAAITEALDRAPPGEVELLLRGFNSPTLWVIPSAERPPLGKAWSHAPKVSAMIMRHMRMPIAPDAIHTAWISPWSGYPLGMLEQFPNRPPQHLLPSRQRLAVVLERPSGSWLTFIVTSGRPSFLWVFRIGLWVVLFGGVMLIFAVWAARRVTRPLRDFAEAAERLGTDMQATPLRETGSGELLEATKAFNRMQDRLRRFVEDRTLMLAAISHDLRTALTRLRLRAEFIDDPEQQRKAENDLDEMQAMLEETLSFSRDEAARELPQKVDVASLVQSLCDDLADAGSRVRFAGAPRTPCLCRPVALRRALSNLILNATSYGGEADVTLKRDEDNLFITVGDRGPGIPEHLREKAFTPFFRVEGSRNRSTGGTGLGLAVARTVVRSHGGDITLHDRTGGGLEARVVIPCRPN